MVAEGDNRGNQGLGRQFTEALHQMQVSAVDTVENADGDGGLTAGWWSSVGQSLAKTHWVCVVQSRCGLLTGRRFKGAGAPGIGDYRGAARCLVANIRCGWVW